MQISVREAARLLSVSERTVYRWIREQKISAYKIGEAYRFNRAELLEWATARRTPASPEIVAEPEDASVLQPSLCEALHAGGIHYRVAGRTREEALRAVVDLMRLPDGMDRSFLYQVLAEREALGSTAVGDGIAVPHPRSPLVPHITSPSVTLSFLEQAVDFDALDGKPVDTLFTIVSPTVRSHLHLLARLAFVLRRDAVADALRGRASREAIVEALAQAESDIPEREESKE